MKNRRDFLKMGSLLSAASLLPLGRMLSAKPQTQHNSSCTLIPTETAGPFPLDLTANTTYFRQDLREGKAGVPLRVRLKIIGAGNCLPMNNVRVNIWHCDKDGLYSGYSETNNPGQAGLTYLRGYQYTDADGEVEFMTIFPGWYNGRICHIHFQVYVSSSYAAISQLTFDVSTKQNIYTSNSSIYTNGTDPMSLQSDNIFSDGYAYQMATLSSDASIGGYEAYLEVTIQGNGTTGLGHLEKENAKHFSLGQNFPNPYVGQTQIPLSLVKDASIDLELFDLQGRKVYAQDYGTLAAGEHQLSLNLASLGLSSGNYIYQVRVSNSEGSFVGNKMMTAQK